MTHIQYIRVLAQSIKKVKFVYEDPDTGLKDKQEFILDSNTPERLLFPTNVYIGLENIGEEEAWLINFPHPAYDPDLKDEQVDKSPQDLQEKVG